MTLKIVFNQDLPTNRTIYVFSSSAPSTLTNGTLLKYANNVAVIWLEGTTVYINYSPVVPIDVYSLSVILAAAGGLVAYRIYKKNKGGKKIIRKIVVFESGRTIRL